MKFIKLPIIFAAITLLGVFVLQPQPTGAKIDDYLPRGQPSDFITNLLPGQSLKVASGSGVLKTEINQDLALKNDSDFSIEAWVKPEPKKVGFNSIFTRYTATAKPRRQIYDLFLYSDPNNPLQKADLRLHLGAITVIEAHRRYKGAILIKDIVPFNQWSHVAVVKKDNNIFLYLNGQKIGQAEFGATLEQDSSLGINYAGGLLMANDFVGNKFEGLIDDLRISNTSRNVEAMWRTKAYQRPLAIDDYTVAMYRFENNTSDYSRAKLDLSLLRDPKYPNVSVKYDTSHIPADYADSFRYGLKFPGQTDQVVVLNPDNIMVTPDYRFSFWFKPNSNQISDPQVIWELRHQKNGDNSVMPGEAFGLALWNGQRLIFRYYPKNNLPITLRSYPLKPNRWHFFKITTSDASPNQLSLYIDGKYMNSVSTTTNLSSSWLFSLGCSFDCRVPFSGAIDEFIWQPATNEIEGLPLSLTDNPELINWRFDYNLKSRFNDVKLDRRSVKRPAFEVTNIMTNFFNLFSALDVNDNNKATDRFDVVCFIVNYLYLKHAQVGTQIYGPYDVDDDHALTKLDVIFSIMDYLKNPKVGTPKSCLPLAPYIH